MLPLYVLLVIDCFINSKGLKLSEWQNTGHLKQPTTQHYLGVDEINNQVYVAGGIESATTATNKFEQISFSIENDSLLLNHSYTNSFLAQQLNLVFDLGDFYTQHQSAGFYDNTLYLLLPFYEGNVDTIHFISCNVIYRHCEFRTALHLNYYDACITQENNFLFVVGGTNGNEYINQIHVRKYVNIISVLYSCINIYRFMI